MSPPPKTCYVPLWWRRALEDGSHCEAKRRELYFHEYLAEARDAFESAGLLPSKLEGVFRFWYRRGFRLGYDNARLKRERDKVWLRKPKKRAKLAK